MLHRRSVLALQYTVGTKEKMVMMKDASLLVNGLTLRLLMVGVSNLGQWDADVSDIIFWPH